MEAYKLISPNADLFLHVIWSASLYHTMKSLDLFVFTWLVAFCEMFAESAVPQYERLYCTARSDSFVQRTINVFKQEFVLDDVRLQH